jgi:hypothetical protein
MQGGFGARADSGHYRRQLAVLDRGDRHDDALLQARHFERRREVAAEEAGASAFRAIDRHKDARTNQKRRCDSVGSLKAIFESSDVERLAGISM